MLELRVIYISLGFLFRSIIDSPSSLLDKQWQTLHSYPKITLQISWIAHHAISSYHNNYRVLVEVDKLQMHSSIIISSNQQRNVPYVSYPYDKSKNIIWYGHSWTRTQTTSPATRQNTERWAQLPEPSRSNRKCSLSCFQLTHHAWRLWWRLGKRWSPRLRNRIKLDLLRTWRTMLTIGLLTRGHRM